MTFKKIVSVFVVTALLGVMIGCANYASFQTPDVTEPKENNFGGGLTYTRYTVDLVDSTNDVDVPAVNFWYRRGLIENLEVHASLWIPLGVSVGAKYQLVGSPEENKGLGLSLGLDVGYMQLTTDADTSNLIDFYVPVYTGVKISEGFGMYLVPKYIGRLAINNNADTDYENIAGGTYGIRFGRKVDLFIEGTAAYSIDGEYPAFTGGIGIGF